MNTLEFLLQKEPEGGFVVRSPAVGVWSVIPAEGTLLDSAASGVLAQGAHRFVVRLPTGVAGIVVGLTERRRKALPVEWGQELFRLAPLTGPAAESQEAGSVISANPSGHELRAPTDGVFYCRPNPDAPPFITKGETVVHGQPIGLIEVMKTFNQVLFEGQGVPASAVVESILVEDGDEVRAADPLIRYRIQ